MVAKSRERSEADTLLIIRERSERTKERPPPNARDERTLKERSGDDSPKGLLSIGEGKSMGKEGTIYFHGRESIHEESR